MKRVVRLAELTPAMQQVVLALIAAEKAAAEKKTLAITIEEVKR